MSDTPDVLLACIIGRDLRVQGHSGTFRVVRPADNQDRPGHWYELEMLNHNGESMGSTIEAEFDSIHHVDE